MKKGANKHKRGFDELRDDGPLLRSQSFLHTQTHCPQSPEHVVSAIVSMLTAFETNADYMKRVVGKFQFVTDSVRVEDFVHPFCP